jgi:hypothetical protein
MTLKETTETAMLINLSTSFERASPRSYLMGYHRWGERTDRFFVKRRTSVFLIIWIGSLKEDFDSIEWSDDGLCLGVDIGLSDLGR